jgi:hypothetical protein
MDNTKSVYIDYHDPNINLKAELLHLINTYMQLRQQQMDILDIYDKKLQQKVNMIILKSKF